MRYRARTARPAVREYLAAERAYYDRWLESVRALRDELAARAIPAEESVSWSRVGHTYFTDWFGIHYGAGLGVGIVTGQILRTSNGSAGCAGNPGSVTACHPIICATGPCTEQQLQAAGSGPDDPANPHRFADSNVPPAIPIINLVLGVDFRLPNVRGWEAKIEGGFYDAFFLGLGVGYTF